MSDSESFKLRLSGACTRAGLTKAELARRIGESPQLVNTWMNSSYENLPAANRVAKIAEALGVNIMWLISGEGSMYSNVIALDNEEFPSADFIQIPESAVSFGAGECPEPTYEELRETLPATYRKDFFSRHGLNPHKCKRVRVQGDSMSPLILDGDCILIDCEHVDHIDNGAVYAIAYDHNLMVKRLISQFGRLVIKSENTSYPDVILSEEEAQNVIILGKVIERSGML
ncbi:MAG: XRE family transcriptional regulator [Succinivibrio sp.]